MLAILLVLSFFLGRNPQLVLAGIERNNINKVPKDHKLKLKGMEKI